MNGTGSSEVHFGPSRPLPCIPIPTAISLVLFSFLSSLRSPPLKTFHRFKIPSAVNATIALKQTSTRSVKNSKSRGGKGKVGKGKGKGNGGPTFGKIRSFTVMFVDLGLWILVLTSRHSSPS